MTNKKNFESDFIQILKTSNINIGCIDIKETKDFLDNLDLIEYNEPPDFLLKTKRYEFLIEVFQIDNSFLKNQSISNLLTNNFRKSGPNYLNNIKPINYEGSIKKLTDSFYFSFMKHYNKILDYKKISSSNLNKKVVFVLIDYSFSLNVFCNSNRTPSKYLLLQDRNIIKFLNNKNELSYLIYICKSDYLSYHCYLLEIHSRVISSIEQIDYTNCEFSFKNHSVLAFDQI
jgi:hypothetical protein